MFLLDMLTIAAIGGAGLLVIDDIDFFEPKDVAVSVVILAFLGWIIFRLSVPWMVL